MNTDEILLAQKYESRLGEAESKRIALSNEYNKQHHLILEVVRANKEAINFVEKAMKGDYSGHDGIAEPITPQQRAQLAGLKHALEQANVMYTTGVNKRLLDKREFWTMPEDPKTNDLFYDGEDYFVYYLGRWNKANPVKG
jgi:hypothetical protein